MRKPKWKDPREYPWADSTRRETNPDPLEFALSVFNEVTDRKLYKKDGKWVRVENGNEARDYLVNTKGEYLLDAEEKRIEAVPGFSDARPKIVSALSRVARGETKSLGSITTNDRGIQLDGLTAMQRGPGKWRIRKSAVNVSQAAHRQVAFAGLFLLDLEMHRSRLERLRQCKCCERFFFHSQKRRNTTGYWCSSVCKKALDRETEREEQKADPGTAALRRSLARG